jgi:hypothetical protein
MGVWLFRLFVEGVGDDGAVVSSCPFSEAELGDVGGLLMNTPENLVLKVT